MSPLGKRILCAPKEYQKRILKSKIKIYGNTIRIHMLYDSNESTFYMGLRNSKKHFKVKCLDIKSYS